jgi:CRISPR-associated protein Cas1
MTTRQRIAELDRVIDKQRLWAGWARTAAGTTMSGFDGVTPGAFAQIVEEELDRLANEVRDGRYRPEPLRTYRRTIGGKVRVFGVASVRDRVLQQAARAALRPWLDDRQADSSFAYLRGRGWLDALSEVEQARSEGLRWLYRFDIRNYFESISHRLLTERLVDDLGSVDVAALLVSWVPCWLVRGNVMRVPSAGITLGLPIAPTLANHFLSEFDRAVSSYCGRLVRYADDGCVLCGTREEAELAQATVTELLSALDLEPNPQKSRVTSFGDGFAYLGFNFQGDSARPAHGSQFRLP